MVALLPTLIALIAGASGFVIAVRSRKSAKSLLRTIVVPQSAAVTSRPIVRGVQLRMLAALVVAVVVTIAVAQLRMGSVSAGLPLAPGIGGAVGLLVLSMSPFPRRVPESGLRQAELTPRTLGGFGPRWGFILPCVAAALLVALLIVTGVSASPIDSPFSHEFMVSLPGGGTSSAGPYPDWSYGLFIIGSTAALIVAMLWALHRVASAPRIGHHDSAVLDGALRAALTRFIMLSGTAVVVLYLGAVSLTAGSAARTASYWNAFKPGFEVRMCGTKTTCTFIATPADTISGVVQPTYTLGAVGAVLGIVLIGVAIVLALLALTNLAIRWSVAAPVEPERVDA